MGMIWPLKQDMQIFKFLAQRKNSTRIATKKLDLKKAQAQ